jgi:deoxyadenosine/deoxycytidine kinase
MMEEETPRRVIALEGDIGVGKSTLCSKFKALFPQKVAVYREQTNELFLRLFYSNPVLYSSLNISLSSSESLSPYLKLRYKEANETCNIVGLFVLLFIDRQSTDLLFSGGC